MLYVIIGRDITKSAELRASVRPAHVARLNQLKDEGRLVLAGPFPGVDSEDPGPAGFSDSLIVAEFSDYQSASDWASSDPYVEAGVYEKTEILPFKMVLP
jgi:uncharacterized protein YciI